MLLPPLLSLPLLWRRHQQPTPLQPWLAMQEELLRGRRGGFRGNPQALLACLYATATAMTRCYLCLCPCWQRLRQSALHLVLLNRVLQSLVPNPRMLKNKEHWHQEPQPLALSLALPPCPHPAHQPRDCMPSGRCRHASQDRIFRKPHVSYKPTARFPTPNDGCLS
jgi:hypothetical protein